MRFASLKEKRIERVIPEFVFILSVSIIILLDSIFLDYK